MNRNSKEMKSKVNLFDIINISFLTLLAIIVLYPFYNSILISLVSQREYIRTPFMIFPKQFDWSSYLYIFESPRIIYGYKNTLILLLFGVPYNMILTTCTAYSLSRKSFPGKKIILALIIFTMYFSGGLIPYYLLVRGLGLINNLASIIFTYGVNTFYMIIMLNYFDTIPASLEESAKLDGANDFVILFKIILPLSSPIIATVILFYAVDRWNEWYNSMLFLRDGKKWPLQLILRDIVMSSIDKLGDSYASLRRTVFPSGVKMASIVVTMAPIMLVYPFLQKYFMKGILIGAIKS